MSEEPIHVLSILVPDDMYRECERKADEMFGEIIVHRLYDHDSIPTEEEEAVRRSKVIAWLFNLMATEIGGE